MVILLSADHENYDIAGNGQNCYMNLSRPLVMNPAILRQNNNYPFKTSRSHVWYIAFHETAVVGFMPVKKGHLYYSIDNYFVSGDDPSVLSELLEEVIKDFHLKLHLWLLCINVM